MSKFKVGDSAATTPEFLAKYGMMAKGYIVEISKSGMLKLSTTGEWYHERDLTDGPCTTPVVPMQDMVNHPPHYTQGDIECIDAIRAALTPDEFRGYCKGAAHKYIWRERHKGGDESLKKAVWYLNKAVEVGDE